MRVTLGTAVLTACADVPGPRPQLLIFLDTDAHVLGTLVGRQDVSPDAAIDTVTVELLDAAGHSVKSRIFAVADPQAWPLSFGVAHDAPTIDLRIRAFRRYFADVLMDANGVAQLEPPYQVTIHRLATVELPARGIKRVLIHLAADCLGIPPSNEERPLTCIEKGLHHGDPREGITVLTDDHGESRNGTWPLALTRSCSQPAAPGRICIPGGFAFLGNANVVGGWDAEEEALPYRPVVMSPYFLDQYEFTVGRLKELLRAGARVGGLKPNHPYCTLLQVDHPMYERLPLNCLSADAAEAICKLVGGNLPSEAQWEFAATGRGRRQLYPWGDTYTGCCISAGRYADGGAPAECDGGGVEPVGSHEANEDCPEGDVSRDGVVDMGGSLKEAVRDDLDAYDARCWREASLYDPVCVPRENGVRAARGSYWNASPGAALSSLRHSFLAGSAGGFRCAYEDR